MADLRPSDPRGLLQDTADNTGSYSEVRRNVFPDEIPTADLPLWGIDPREAEQDHEATGGGGRIYKGVPIEYIVYIAVESGPEASDRSSAEDSLSTLRDEYLTDLFDRVATNSTDGSAQKTSRIRSEITQTETIVLVDAMTIRVRQLQIYK